MQYLEKTRKVVAQHNLVQELWNIQYFEMEDTETQWHDLGN